MYVKQFDDKGNVINPITKASPFVNAPSTKIPKEQRKKGRMIVLIHGLSFFRYVTRLQKIGRKTIEQSRLVSSSTVLR